jgi:enolase
MAKIKEIKAREILDSMGNPTVETKIVLDNGISAKASVPIGVSNNSHAACELFDGDKNRYGGLGVLSAVKNINEVIAPELIGDEIVKQSIIDDKMIKLDNTPNKKKLGSNAILSVSIAAARAGALSRDQELYEYLHEIFGLQNDFSLPTPSFNIFNGGKHADTNLDFQEFMIMPIGHHSFREKVRRGAEIFHELAIVLKKGGFDTDVGAEGGYAPDIISSVQAIEFIVTAIINAGYKPKRDIGLNINVGSSGLYNKESEKYVFKLDNAFYASADLIGLYEEWLGNFPILAIEDGLSEDDWSGWKKLTMELGEKIMLAGDNFFATNINLLRKGLKEKTANAILIKPIQAGTLSETIECIKLAQRHHYKVIISHCSEETNDDFIADLSVAVGADFIKAGSLSRGERLAKYNRLMEIEDFIN